MEGAKVLCRLFIFLLVVAIVLVVTPKFYYYTFVFSGESREDVIIANRIISKISAGDNMIMLRDIVDFDWDNVCVISPYISKEDLEARIGYEHVNYKKLRWIEDESKWGLLFIDKNIKMTPIKFNKNIVGSILDPYQQDGKRYSHDSAMINIVCVLGVQGKQIKIVITDSNINNSSRHN